MQYYDFTLINVEHDVGHAWFGSGADEPAWQQHIAILDTWAVLVTWAAPHVTYKIIFIMLCMSHDVGHAWCGRFMPTPAWQ